MAGLSGVHLASHSLVPPQVRPIFPAMRGSLFRAPLPGQTHGHLDRATWEALALQTGAGCGREPPARATQPLPHRCLRGTGQVRVPPGRGPRCRTSLKKAPRAAGPARPSCSGTLHPLLARTNWRAACPGPLSTHLLGKWGLLPSWHTPHRSLYLPFTHLAET